MYVIFASYGNDSIALIQWAFERHLKDVIVVYSDTGWSADYWGCRVSKAEDWVESLGYRTDRTQSEGMRNLVMRKKAWPRGGGGKFQFCTETLKKLPAIKWLDENDPQKIATCLNGVRRCESRNRLTAPEWVAFSPEHGDRDLWSPLVRHSDKDRNLLIRKTPFQVLPYKSKECWPCVNAGKKELRHLNEERIKLIEEIELEAGINSQGNPRVMFSPARHNNCVGIRDVVNDASKGMNDLLPVRLCSSGWCND